MDLYATITELSDRACERGRPYATNFVAREDVEKALGYALWQGLPLRPVGGAEDCERARLVLMPDAWSQPKDGDFVRALRVAVNDGREYSHRDYLGSIMALGIERDTVGDILPGPGFALVYVLPTVAEYLLLNLKTVSRTGCTVEPCSGEVARPADREGESVTLSVSSLRCDCVASALFHLSRESCAAMIERGLLRVNGEVCLKPDRKVELPVRLALKGQGMAEAQACTGTSRKGKLRISASVYR